MTTHTQPLFNNAPDGLVVPSLVSMANKGFDTPALMQMQLAAFRVASQRLQHRAAAGKTTHAADIKALVDRSLAGDNFNGASHEVTPAHVSAYMHAKALLQSSGPSEIMAEANTLAEMQLPVDEFGPDAQLKATLWLAKHVTALHQYADNLEKTTPMFAKTIRDRADQIVSSYTDQRGLKVAFEVLQENSVQHLEDNEAPDNNGLAH